jgi:hypothetical protein
VLNVAPLIASPEDIRIATD